MQISVLGQGIVGGAFSELLEARKDQIKTVTGSQVEQFGVLTHSRGDFSELLDNADIIVEAIGGTDDAYHYVKEALEAERHVITANKQLLAKHGQELWQLAKANDVQLRFEAAVGGVIPVVRVIHESLAVSRIDRLQGIVNGTTNFIVTQMHERGLSYDEALGEAQEKGYAEANPTDDVEGIDAAAKLSILALLAFGASARIDEIRPEGITQLTQEDFDYAERLGRQVKLIASAERQGQSLELQVGPALVDSHHPLANIQDSTNAVSVQSDSFSEITLVGPGAGGPETATAILGDLVSIISGARVPVPERTEDLIISQDITSAYYLSMGVFDQPGVLAQVTRVLAGFEISIESVLQEGQGEEARLVMILHGTQKSRLETALRDLGALEVVSDPKMIRVID